MLNAIFPTYILIGKRLVVTLVFLFVYYLTASFNALPGLNAGTLLAGISISSPV